MVQQRQEDVLKIGYKVKKRVGAGDKAKRERARMRGSNRARGKDAGARAKEEKG